MYLSINLNLFNQMVFMFGLVYHLFIKTISCFGLGFVLFNLKSESA